jgi:MFS family permease
MTYGGQDEKAKHLVEDHIERTASEESYDARINAFTPEEQKKIVRRIDRRLVMTLGLMYCVSLMDRTNLGLAAIGGMAVDLDLVGNRYSLITLIFFIPYILFQPPATVVLRKIGPRIFLSVITLLWGLTMLSFGFVKQWYQLMPLRVILGIFEAGFFPGCAYLLSCWCECYFSLLEILVLARTNMKSQTLATIYRSEMQSSI